MNKQSKAPGEICFNIANTLIMLAVLLLTLYPFWYCIITSFNDSRDFIRGPLYVLPRKFTIENYSFIMSSRLVLTAARNSVLRTVIGTVLHCVVTGAAAFGLSKRDLIGRRVYTTLFIITMYFSGGMIPKYLLMRGLHLLDNFLVYILPMAWSFYNAILFMAYYESIPDSLEESARIDGAGAINIFFRIIFPSALPVFATIALFSGVAHWNSWYDTMIYTKSDSLVTLQAIMIRMLQQVESDKAAQKMMANLIGTEAVARNISPLTVRVATMVITTFPIVVVYPFFQKYFIKGMMLGAVKG